MIYDVIRIIFYYFVLALITPCRLYRNQVIFYCEHTQYKNYAFCFFLFEFKRGEKKSLNKDWLTTSKTLASEKSDSLVRAQDVLRPV